MLLKVGGYNGIIGTGTLVMDWKASTNAGLNKNGPLNNYLDESFSRLRRQKYELEMRCCELASKYDDFENATLRKLAEFNHFTKRDDIFATIDSHSHRFSWNSKMDGAYPHISQFTGRISNVKRVNEEEVW